MPYFIYKNTNDNLSNYAELHVHSLDSFAEGYHIQCMHKSVVKDLRVLRPFNVLQV